MNEVCRLGRAAVVLMALIAGLAACAATPDLGDGAVDNDELDGPIGRTSQELLGTVCQGSTQTNCWMVGYSGPNFRTFNFGRGLGCAVVSTGMAGSYTYRQVMCGTSDGTLPNPAGWGEPNSSAPNDINSIAISDPFLTDTSIFILGSDHVVRRTTGDLTQAWFGGTNFRNYSVHVNAVTNTGSTICLSKIDVVTLPSYGGPNRTLVGLSCSGKLWYVAFQGSTRVWFPSSSGPPWNNLPSLTFTDMGHSNASDTYRLYLLDTMKRVWRIGAGKVNLNGTVTWSPSQVLPSVVTPSGSTVSPIAVGGQYIITDAGGGVCTAISQPCLGDDDRFYRFNNSTGSWIRLNIGTPSLPGTWDDVTQGQPYRRIVDASSFVLTNGLEIGVWHMNHRINTYSWP